MLEEEALLLEKSFRDWARRQRRWGGVPEARVKDGVGVRAVLRAEGKAVTALERKP